MDPIARARPAVPERPLADPAKRAALREAAVRFEATFLAEMFKHAGAGRATPGFDGGEGEAAFSGMLVNEQTKMLAERGGVGIAETVFEALLRKEGLQ